MSPIDWKPRSLADLSPLRHAYFDGVLPHSGHPVLKVSLIGQAGNEREHQGAFAAACARIVAGLEAWQPWAVILDLTSLRYEWGDEMQNVLTVADRWYESYRPLRQALSGGRLPEAFPTAVVTSADNADALKSLVTAECVEGVVLCESVDEAVQIFDQMLEGIAPW